MRRVQLLGVAAAAALIVLSLASCSPDPTPTVHASPSAPTVAPSGDGVLRIGTLFPTTGASAFIAPAQAAGVEAAVREINLAGGVLGKPVEVIQSNSGDVSTTTMETSFAALVTKKIDVVIGPSSSILVTRLLPKTLAAKVTVISPAATSPTITTLDDSGSVFRTIPSDALEGTALGQIIGKTAGAKVALVYFDDESGAAIHSGLEASLGKAGGTLVTAQKFDAKTNLTTLMKAVTAAKPDAVVLASPFSAAAQNKTLLTQLSAAKLGGAKLWLTSGNLSDYSQALPAGLLKGVNGILEGAQPDAAFTAKVKAVNAKVTDFRYAAEAYDATILAALAATTAKDDGAASIAANLSGVSQGGIKCLGYAECLGVLKTQSNIDYDGPSGPLNFDAQGDLRVANYGIYSYAATNKFARTGSFAAG